MPVGEFEAGEHTVDTTETDADELTIAAFGQRGEDAEQGFTEGDAGEGGEGGFARGTVAADKWPALNLYIPSGRESPRPESDGGEGGDSGGDSDDGSGGDGAGLLVVADDADDALIGAGGGGGGGGGGRVTAFDLEFGGGGGGGGASGGLGGEAGAAADGDGEDGQDADGTGDTGGDGGDGGDAPSGDGEPGEDGMVVLDSAFSDAARDIETGTFDGDAAVVIVAVPSDADATDDGDEIALSWTDTNDGEASEYRIYRDTASGVETSDEPYATVDGAETTFTDSDVDLGTEYFYVVTAAVGDGDREVESSPSDEVSAEASLTPPENLRARLISDSETELLWEIDVEGDGVRVLVSTDDAETFDEVAVLDGDAESFVVDGLNPDIEEWFRVEAFNGGVAAADDIRPIGPLSVADARETELDIEWPNNTIDADRVVFEAARIIDGDPREPVIQTLDADADAASVEGRPGTEYHITAQIESDDPETTRSAGELTATTDDLGVPRQRIPSDEAHAEFVAEPGTDDSITLRPRILGVEHQPGVNARPAATVTIPHSAAAEERYGDALDTGDGDTGDVEARLWRDGTRLPIDRLDDVRVDRSSATIDLVCSGGRQLERFVAVQFDEAESHDAAEGLVGDETDYATDFDDPASDEEADILFASGQGAGLDSVFGDAPETQPYRITSLNGLESLQTGWLAVSDFTTNATEVVDETAGWVDNRAVRLNSSGDYVRWNIQNPQYTIPETAASAMWSVIDDNPAIEVTIGGTVVETISESALITDSDRGDTSYRDFTTSGPEVDGTTTVEIRATSTISGEGIYVDAGFGFDPRFSYDFVETTDANDQVAGPQEYPDELDVLSEDFSSVQLVIGGRLDVSDAVGQVAISNDGFDEQILTANDADSVEGSFAESGTSLQARVRFVRRGSRTDDSPTEGFEGEAIDFADLFADLDDTPLLLDRVFEGELDGILNEIAESGLFVWELARDPDADPADRDGLIVRWTQEGQRERDGSRQPTRILGVSGRKTIEERFERVIVDGASFDNDDTFEAETLDTLVGLDGEPIKVASETVTTTDGETEFVRGEDYRMDYAEGAIALLSGGDMSTGVEYAAEYAVRVRGQYPPDIRLDNPDDARTLRERIPAATSDREAELLALAIFREVQDPLVEGTVTLATDRPDASLIEALAAEATPFSTGGLVVFDADISETAAGIDLDVGSRQTARESINRIEQQFAQLADRV